MELNAEGDGEGEGEIDDDLEEMKQSPVSKVPSTSQSMYQQQFSAEMNRILVLPILQLLSKLQLQILILSIWRGFRRPLLLT